MLTNLNKLFTKDSFEVIDSSYYKKISEEQEKELLTLIESRKIEYNELKYEDVNMYKEILRKKKIFLLPSDQLFEFAGLKILESEGNIYEFI